MKGEQLRVTLCLLTTVITSSSVPTSAAGQDVSRSGSVTVNSMKREFDTMGDIVYELRLKLPNSTLHFVTASKPGAPCDGIFVGDDSVSATYTASTITLTQGKSVCRLTIRRMF